MLKVWINGLAGFQSAGELVGPQLPSLPGPVMACDVAGASAADGWRSTPVAVTAEFLPKSSLPLKKSVGVG
jgi:hypothetical protein